MAQSADAPCTPAATKQNDVERAPDVAFSFAEACSPEEVKFVEIKTRRSAALATARCPA